MSIEVTVEYAHREWNPYDHVVHIRNYQQLKANVAELEEEVERTNDAFEQEHKACHDLIEKVIPNINKQLLSAQAENKRLKTESRDACLGLNDYYGRKLAAAQEENGRLENQVLARDAELWGRTQEILGLKDQLAAEQLNNKLLREALTTCVCAMQDYQAGIGITEMFDTGERLGRKALSSPASTEALDAYVVQKIKEYN